MNIQVGDRGVYMRKYKRGSQCIRVPVSGEQCVGACRYGGLRGAISDYFALVTARCRLL
jgi:hypothetical protein